MTRRESQSSTVHAFVAAVSVWIVPLVARAPTSGCFRARTPGCFARATPDPPSRVPASRLDGAPTTRALDRSTSELEGFFDPVERSLAVAHVWAAEGTLDPDAPDRLEALFRPMLEAYPLMSSINLGDSEGG